MPASELTSLLRDLIDEHGLASTSRAFGRAMADHAKVQHRPLRPSTTVLREAIGQLEEAAVDQLYGRRAQSAHRVVRRRPAASRATRRSPRR